MSDVWRSGLRMKLEDFVDTFVVSGARQEEVFDAIVQEISNLRVAYDQDPDPADDETAVDEPANEWPAAER